MIRVGEEKTCGLSILVYITLICGLQWLCPFAQGKSSCSWLFSQLNLSSGTIPLLASSRLGMLMVPTIANPWILHHPLLVLLTLPTSL